jgi:uncharacterized protein YciI
MDEHNEWIKRGFDDGVYILTGGLHPGLGGAVLAHNTTLSELQIRFNDDPFVAENIVTAEILEITPAQTDERLEFLVDG